MKKLAIFLVIVAGIWMVREPISYGIGERAFRGKIEKLPVSDDLKVELKSRVSRVALGIREKAYSESEGNYIIEVMEQIRDSGRPGSKPLDDRWAKRTLRNLDKVLKRHQL